MEELKELSISRRNFLKYGAASVAAVVGGAAGYWAYEELKKLYKTPTVTPTPTPTPDITPPVIKDLKWEPTRAVNNKVYDGNVSFVAEDLDSLIAEAYLDFEPVYPSHLPREAFSEESSKQYSFAGASKRETFSQNVTDLKGGKEYKVRVRAKDKAGNESESSLDIPYVREFENIAPLDDKLIIADYYTWYEKPSDAGNHWRYYKEEINGPSQHLQNPLLSEYASGVPIVIARHIDWATGHGIDAFSISWHTTGNDERTWDYHVTRNFESFLNNPLNKDIMFCILYEDYDRLRKKIITYEYDPVHGTELIPLDDPENKERLISDFKFFAKSYFNHPKYLKIEGKPFVQFDADRLWSGNIEATLSQLREEIKKDGYELYLCGNILGWYFPGAPYDKLEPRNRQIVKSMDGISASGNMWLYGYEEARKDFPSFVKSLYERWYRYGMRFNPKIQLLPNIMPGEETHPLIVNDPSYVPLKRSTKLWDDLIEIAKRYGKIWKITSFNEWIAGHQIEPSKDDGFAYLGILKDNL